jgi:PAS domain S-box-containing protein
MINTSNQSFYSIPEALEKALTTDDNALRQQLIREVHQQLKSWSTNAQTSFFAYDEHGIIRHGNPKFYELTGYTPEEVEGKLSFDAILLPESAELYRRQLKPLLEQGIVPPETEYQFISKKGVKYAFLLLESRMEDEKGMRPRHACILQDVTERRRIFDELDDLYNNVPVGYHSLDTNGVIIRMNDTALEWFGYTRSEVEGKMHITEIIIPELRHNFHQNFENLKKEGKVINAVVPMIRRDGSRLSILLNTIVIRDEADNYISNRAVMWDITEKLKLEEELKRTAAALYEANEDKNRFIGVASHDLQNPITAIAMSAELLDKTATTLNPMQKKLIKSIRSSAERMNYVVTNILNINRIERGMISDDWRIINLKSTIWDVVNRYQIFASRKNIEIVQLVAENVDWNMYTEPNYLIQAIENLLSNAIKFSERGKKITIELRKNTTPHQFYIAIHDQGQGIKAEDLPKLFGKFQKLSARPTGGETSTGLGLSVAKEFVEILRGGIECQSIWGLGTTFIIHLPIENQAKTDISDFVA